MNSILTFLNSLFSQSWWSGVSVLLGALLGAFASIIVSWTQGHREKKRIRHEYYVNQNDKLIADSAAFIRLCLAHNDAVRDAIAAKNRYDSAMRKYEGLIDQDIRIALENQEKEADATLLDLQEGYSRLIMRFPDLKDAAQALLANLPDRSDESRGAWNKSLSVFRETVTSLYAENERKSLLTWFQRKKSKRG
ncbi:hypothetical protein [Alloscardovia omnicolens]|uniref:hypothetical protein n=1 Tax=Alloscardovia omnicolens TaxID=419015 RepID=UPI0006695A4C|nr:hypothetical protein [Alloscardovia omnicolens]MDK6327615.1 hypothetical protein [Alloscardovia omnicolens]MDK6663904.1 hypothetical protein [Alloscardovia omnicolens]MDK7748260.1 hypothetical protein [Alloscardovia omnicolens]MDK8073695.1 hypothetical protein [Alloscardovia omnicolens]MDK8081536.1 hypothetical protein [Alloscardovia omnicolens]